MASYLSERTNSISCWSKAAIKTISCKFKNAPLPPGSLSNLYSREVRDQRYLLKQTQIHGPIFKTRMGENLAICVVGLDRCRRLIAAREHSLTPASVELKPITPNGFMREMKGETHTKYRSILIKGVRSVGAQRNRTVHERIITQALTNYAASSKSQVSPEGYIRFLDTITQSILLHLFFGAEPNSGYQKNLVRSYHKLWDPLWHYYMSDLQIEGYKEVKAQILASLQSNPSESVQQSIVGRIHEAGALDETILTNIIYMVETGRFPIFSLMRWTTKYCVDHPGLSECLAVGYDSDNHKNEVFDEAFIHETLRLNQIERLLRTVDETFEFEGVLFPKGVLARLCLWESHKSPEVFPDPFRFNPQRFLDKQFSLDEFAPFGVGSHRCPVGSLSIQICALFLQRLSSGFHLEALGNEAPVRGVGHYEPAKTFTVKLVPKTDN